MTPPTPPAALADRPRVVEGPLDGLAADAREVAAALAAMAAEAALAARPAEGPGRAVLIPSQALRLVADLGTYGD